MTINVPVKEYNGYKICLMRDSDAPAVVNIYRTIYGDQYPIKEMYDSRYIIAQQEEGLMYRVLARDSEGKVLAHHAMYRLKENYSGLYEGGQGMVLPEGRGKAFSNVLQDYMAQVLAPAVGVEELWGESVTNHVFMQKAVLFVGGKETGIELEVMPAESYEAEKSSPGRVSTVVSNFVLKEKPHTVFLPPPYAPLLKKIYDNAKRDRKFDAGTKDLSDSVKTRYANTFIPSAGVLRITLFEAGKDAGEIIADLVQKHTAAGAVVLQVFIPLGKAYSGTLTELLNREGFFFAALVARWFDADGLMLQKLVQPTNYDNIHLHSTFAKDMLKFIIQDRNRVEAMAAW